MVLKVEKTGKYKMYIAIEQDHTVEEYAHRDDGVDLTSLCRVMLMPMVL